jgi:hypothetical protein
MKRLLTILSLIAIAAVPVASFAQDAPYEWTISDSNASPYVNTDLTTGFHTVYLWLACCDLPGTLQDGMAAAEFAIVTTPPGANLHIATNTGGGIGPFLNAGTTTDLLLAVGGCPCGPVVAAALLVIINVPGTMALAPTSTTQTKGTVDCSLNPSLWPMDWIGLGLLGTPAPSKGTALCMPISVEESTWGEIKGLYR